MYTYSIYMYAWSSMVQHYAKHLQFSQEHCRMIGTCVGRSPVSAPKLFSGSKESGAKRRLKWKFLLRGEKKVAKNQTSTFVMAAKSLSPFKFLQLGKSMKHRPQTPTLGGNGSKSRGSLQRGTNKRSAFYPTALPGG